MKAIDNYQVNIRYIGILEPVKKIMIIIEYLIVLTPHLQHKTIGSKVINQILLKHIGEWLLKITQSKPKYTDLVVLENSHYILDTLAKLMQKAERCDYLEPMVQYFKKMFEEYADKYI